jgi:fibronectin type 3 domain-containing protein
MPTGLLARSQIISSLYAGVKTVVLRWNANADPVVGYNVYRAEVSGGPYKKINAAPISSPEWKDRFLKPAVIYYYTVTAVDAQGRESRASLEAADSPNAWVN